MKKCFYTENEKQIESLNFSNENCKTKNVADSMLSKFTKNVTSHKILMTYIS